MTSKPASTRQQSSTSVPIAKPRCKIHATAIVADKAQITGSHLVEIGGGTIIHPHAKIKAEHGNVIIGKGCILAEKAVVGRLEAGDDADADVTIGDGVDIQASAFVEAKKIADHTTIEIAARVERMAVVGRWCKIAPKCEVKEGQVLEDFSVVFGDGSSGKRVDAVLRDRKDVRDAQLKGRGMEMELLKGLIPDGSMKWRT